MSEQIEKLVNMLDKNGFDWSDYVISLQGPTVFFTVTGKSKMNIKVENKINKLNVLIN